MKFTLSFSLAFILLVLFEFTAFGQFRVRNHPLPTSYFANDDHEIMSTKRWSLPGLVADKQSTFYKPSAQLLSLPVSQGESYWMGSITTQSYNQGKIGRFYYWDIQGNLRGSNLFLDIAGKNKRGLKLVFPRYRAIF